MRRMSRERGWERVLETAGLLLLVLATALGCANKKRGLAGIGAGTLGPGDAPDPCSIPKVGCPCSEEGEEVPCGSTASTDGGVVMCSKGTRVCDGGSWGECENTHLEEQSLGRTILQMQPLALGGQADCPVGADYDCDPYCNYQNDTPDNTIDAGPNFDTDGGLSIKQTGTGASTCMSIAISVRSPTTAANYTVTGFSPFTTDQTSNQVNLQVTATPSTCVTAPFDTTWTIDKFDRAAITGNKNDNGVVTLTNGVAGPIKVTAYAAGLSASLTIPVRVNVVEVPGSEPTPSAALVDWRVNKKVTALADVNRFGTGTNVCQPSPSSGSMPSNAACRNSPLSGTTASTVSYLYPYPATWFPLGLIAPVIQYTYPSATNNDKAVKLSLRYPKNKTLTNIAADTTANSSVYFNYSLIVRETNNFVQYEPTTLAAAQPLDPQVQIPQVAWKAFEQTVRSYGDAGNAAGYDADILVQRLVGTTLENEYRWGGGTQGAATGTGTQPIHFVGGQLKGTVYYNSYNSVAGGSTSSNVVGAVLKINPGDTSSTPTAAIPGSQGKCTICHSVSADGSTLTFASGDASGSGCPDAVYMTAGSTYRENTCSWNMPGGTFRSLHPGNTADPYKFLWGGPYPDGSFYLNNIWDNSRILSSNYPTGAGAAAPAGLYRTSDGVLLASTGAPTTPVTPAFSPDGTKLAYNKGSANASNLSVKISEISACSVPVGPKVSEVASCGQTNGLTISEVSSCPSVTISEVEACGSVPAPRISEVSSCPTVSVSEVAPCGSSNNAPVISEVSACRQFGGNAGEAIEVRNESGQNLNTSTWTVRAGTSTCSGGTACSNLAISGGAPTALQPGNAVVFTTSNTTSCLPDNSTGNVVTICSGTTVIATTTYALGGTCSSTARRKATRDCDGNWTSTNGGSSGPTNDTTNDRCAEAVEIRNDTAVSVNIGDWKVKNAGNTVCVPIPAGTNLAPGDVWRGYVNTATPCFADAGDTAQLFDASSTTGTLRSSRAYSGNSCTTGATGAKRGVLSCAGAWTNNNGGGGNDTSNDSCSNTEGVEIRNDGPNAYVIPAGYTIKSGSCASPTACVTFASATTIGAMSSQVFPTTAAGSTNCLNDGTGTAVLCNAGTAVLTQAYAQSCGATAQRSQVACTGAWTDNVNGYGFDASNDTCTSTAFEAVEIRNDAAATVNIANWVVKNSSGAPCATVPSGTVNLPPGQSYRLYPTSGSCFLDTGEQLGLYTSAASTTAVTTHIYTSSACGTSAKRSVFSCAGVWTENTTIASLAAQNDTSNDTCTVPATGRAEGIDIRNDTPADFAVVGGWVVKQGACVGGTQCGTALSAQTLSPGATLHVNTNAGGLSCLPDAGGTVSLCDGTNTIASYTYSQTCGQGAASTVQRSSRSCGGTWSNANGLTFDSGNDGCAASSQIFEAVEIRNDTHATLPISDWSVHKGTSCAGALCGVVPTMTPDLTTGTSYRVYTTAGACLDDVTGDVAICDQNNVLQQTRHYSHTACGNKGRLDCVGSWTDTVSGGGDDTTNNTCSSQPYEWIEIRNDTAGAVDIGNWSARVGSTPCLTVPVGTTLAQGGVYQAYAAGACMPDTTATISLYDDADNLVTTQTYASTCSTSNPKRGLLPCSGAWSNDTSSSSSSNNSCTFSGSYATSGDELYAMSFDNTTKTFSADTKIVDCADAAQAGHEKCTRPSYPAFLPDNSGVLFQHQLVDSQFETGLNSAYGALAQVWITKPNSKVPRALDNLNGWNGTSAVTVPTAPRNAGLATPTGTGTAFVYDPKWHNGTGTVWIMDQFGGCSTTQNAVSAREDKLNYYPTVSPQEAGDTYWSIFTTRRMYGNVAIANPWQVQRSNDSSNRLGKFTGSCNTAALNAMSPGSGFIDAKKLWVSAIDKNWDGAADPSHPPFYLPGQELQAGNSHGYWVAAACAAEGAACETNDDCCGGTGSPATMHCRTELSGGTTTKTCSAVDDCSTADQACTTSDDCCGGLECPPGGGLCLNIGGLSYEKQTYTREYLAQCPTGTQVKWGRFEWQGTFPAGTEIDFYVQTKAKEADTYQPSSGTPATKAELKKAKTTTAAGAWDGADVAAVLAAANPAVGSLDYLRVTMTFVPNSGGTATPVLGNWRQIYDCLPAE